MTHQRFQTICQLSPVGSPGAAVLKFRTSGQVKTMATSKKAPITSQSRREKASHDRVLGFWDRFALVVSLCKVSAHFKGIKVGLNPAIAQIEARPVGLVQPDYYPVFPGGQVSR